MGKLDAPTRKTSQKWPFFQKYMVKITNIIPILEVF